MTLQSLVEQETIAAAQNFGEKNDIDALMVVLGKQQKAIAQMPELAYDPALDPPYESTHMGLLDDLKSLGAKIAAKWSRSLYQVICGADADNEERKKLFDALGAGEATAIGVVTAMLLPVVSPAIAAPLAAIIVKKFLAPAGTEICIFWGEQLED